MLLKAIAMIVLDLLLGTLHMPRGKVPERYGIDDPVPSTYVSQLFYPFRTGTGERTAASEAREGAGSFPHQEKQDMDARHRVGREASMLEPGGTFVAEARAQS